MLPFLEKQALLTDVFCFQEVHHGDGKYENEKGVLTDSFATLEKILSDFAGAYTPSVMVDFGPATAPYGMAMFVKKNIQASSRGVYEIFKLDEDVGLPAGMKNWDRLMQYATVPLGDSNVTVFNLHGFYVGGTKGDTDTRIEQSKRVKAFMDKHPGEKILCGDFNLDPDTNSFRMMGEGLRDLIKENGIESTRSHHYDGEKRWADYVLVSPGVHVEKFEVLQDVVSDHLPLLLEFN